MEPCPNCGQPVRATARFCTSCGYRIPERAQGSTDSNKSSYAYTWIEESTGVVPAVDGDADPSSTWPVATAEETAPAADVEWVAPAAAVVADEAIYAPPAVAVDPIDEIVAATAGFNTNENTIANTSANKINVALYHIETLRQLMPDLSNWSQDRAEAVNDAIAAMEAALKGREEDDAPFSSLRQTVAAAKRDPRDIDVMVALSDRSKDIEDLLAAHDKYSIGIRTALIDLKPLAVEYIRMPKRRVAPARKPASSRSRSTASKTTTAAKTSATTKPATTAKTAATRTATTAKTTGTASTRKTSTRAASSKS